MFIKVCDDFIKMMRELVKRDIEFQMWTDSFNGNVGINITGKNGNNVDIAQYMSPISISDEEIKMHPIGLDIKYKTKLGSEHYDEGNDVESFLSDILKFIEEETK